jgi:HlyD family secretion protein
MKKTIQASAFELSCFLAVNVFILFMGCEKRDIRYEYAVISRGNLETTVSSTGTLEPAVTVAVLSPQTGIVETLYADYNEPVKKGTILADINTQADPALRQLVAVYSPIDGIVLDRAVNTGSSVLARGSPAATTLFTLASSLLDMKITASIGQLDIDSIREGQDVRITLQALPGRRYTGKVESIRLMPIITDNVVSYKVTVKLNNTDGTLRPGMTCALQFVRQKEEKALLVSNAALRYTPGAGISAAVPKTSPENRATSTTGVNNAVTNAITGGRAGGNPYGHPTGGQSMYNNDSNTAVPANSTGEAAPSIERTLWYTDDTGKVSPIQVYTGISDGLSTVVNPVESGRDIEGMKVILREAE